jgi:hypothetical protein
MMHKYQKQEHLCNKSFTETFNEGNREPIFPSNVSVDSYSDLSALHFIIYLLIQSYKFTFTRFLIQNFQTYKSWKSCKGMSPITLKNEPIGNYKIN